MISGNVIFYIILIVLAIIMICYYMRSYKPAKASFQGMISGAIGLLGVHFLGGYIGIYLPINLFTTVVSLILGIPGIVGMIILQNFIL